MKVKLNGVKRIDITGDFIRLDALLKYASIVSTGGEAKMLIQSGEVYVGGEPCLMRGRKLKQDDVVRYGEDTVIVRQAK